MRRIIISEKAELHFKTVNSFKKECNMYWLSSYDCYKLIRNYYLFKIIFSKIYFRITIKNKKASIKKSNVII